MGGDPRVAVIGAGSWGTAFAGITAGNGVQTILWARREELADAISTRDENPDYLPGVELPPPLGATHDLERALSGATVAVMAIPSQAFRSIFTTVAGLLDPDVPVVSLVKGIEQDSLMRMSEEAQEEADLGPRRIAVLSGPNLAKEIAQRLHGAVLLRLHQHRRGRLRARGGDEERHRHRGRDRGSGLAEIARLGVKLGGDPLTFSGLAGMGDLVATCISPLSRNRTVGEQLGKGRKLDEVIAEMNMVAEGVKTSRLLCAIAEKAGVEVPIAEHVVKVLYDGVPVEDMVRSLMLREAKPEIYGLS
jgi:glycerol-3-phosphate dehydrogenase (NAD(P)+)